MRYADFFCMENLLTLCFLSGLFLGSNGGIDYASMTVAGPIPLNPPHLLGAGGQDSRGLCS